MRANKSTLGGRVVIARRVALETDQFCRRRRCGVPGLTRRFVLGWMVRRNSERKTLFRALPDLVSFFCAARLSVGTAPLFTGCRCGRGPVGTASGGQPATFRSHPKATSPEAAFWGKYAHSAIGGQMLRIGMSGRSNMLFRYCRRKRRSVATASLYQGSFSQAANNEYCSQLRR